MKKWIFAVIVCVLVSGGCGRWKRMTGPEDTDQTAEESTEDEVLILSENTAGGDTGPSGKTPVKAKGIYISGYMAGAEGLQAILDEVDRTEINAVVIDVKNDDGRITYHMDGAPTVREISASVNYIQDIGALMADLKARGIYTIARVVAFRDPYLAEQKPEWSLKNADGSLHRDNKGLAWVNPYRQEVWDYLVEVGSQAAADGFDEIQFDYIRFATDSTMKQVVIDEADTKGRTRTEIITEFISYAYKNLSAKGVFVSADVFGTIIGSKIDADTVGQVYHEMAKHLDYICPMIYPSHYGDGNFGIEYPDTQPYDTVLAALSRSRADLASAGGGHQAVVRPWLQDFTASYLSHYIKYGPEEVRAQIQAVYDSGYDEWLLWSASNQYTWEGLLTPEEAAKEEERIAESRAALPTEAESSEAVALQGEESPTETLPSVSEEAPSTVEISGSVSEETLPAEAETQEEKERGHRKPDVVIITTGSDQDY